MNDEKVFCPIINKFIDSYECFETCNVAEKMAKPVIGNTEVLNTPGFRKQCMACPNHFD